MQQGRVDLWLIFELDREVLAGDALGLEHGLVEDDRRVRRRLGAVGAPRRHADAEAEGIETALLVVLQRLRADGAGALRRVLQALGVGEELGEPDGATLQQACRSFAAQHRREVECADLEVAEVEQVVAPAKVDELSFPRLDRPPHDQLAR